MCTYNQFLCRRIETARWLMLAGLALGCLAFSGSAKATAPRALKPAPRGVFALDSARSTVSAAILRQPFVDGVAIRARWRQLEPRPGQYDWEELDRQIRLAEAAGKSVKVLVSSGANAPDWALKDVPLFAYGGQNRFQKQQGARFSMPLPWNDLYLTRWIKFVRVLGRHLEARESVLAVQMTGPTAHSGELHLPNRRRDLRNWLDPDYALPRPAGDAGVYQPSKYLAAWKRVIAAYDAAFPRTHLSLAVSKLLPLRENGEIDDAQPTRLLRQLTSHAREQLGGRLILQSQGLGAKRREGQQERLEVLAEHARQGVAGFQMVWFVAGDANFRANRGEPASAAEIMERSLQRGQALGAQFVEIYLQDLEDRETSEVIARLRDKFRQR